MHNFKVHGLRNAPDDSEKLALGLCSFGSAWHGRSLLCTTTATAVSGLLMSHTPSRPGTPGPRSSPSRLSIGLSLRPTPSLSNLHIHSYTVESSNLPPVPPLPTHISSQTLESSASSVITVDTNEGILLQDVDAEAEYAEDITVMSLDTDVERGDEGSKQTLRDQLRKTLSHKISRPGGILLFRCRIHEFHNVD